MEKTGLGGVDVHNCGNCGGTWLDKEIFENLSADREKRGQALMGLGTPAERFVPEQTATYRPCPICGGLMNRVNYARISGVIIDICKSHGIWFDRDELKNILTFIEKGGLVRAQEKERMKLEDARREAESAKTSMMAGMPSGEINFYGKGSVRRSQTELSDVLDFIDNVIDFFKKK
jgi:Zn-finger nucleic acid-binding protein